MKTGSSTFYTLLWLLVIVIVLACLATSARAEGDGKWSTVTITAYCPCKKCCGSWSKYQRTASGTQPTSGRTIAAPRALEFGSKIFVPGHGWRVVEDRTAKRFDGRFDLFVDSHQKAQRLGIRKMKVYVK